jgi:hypothetical protein
MHLTQDNHMMHTLTLDRSDQPFDNAVLAKAKPAR